MVRYNRFEAPYKTHTFLVRFEVDSEVSWIKVNVNQSGFYRVMYEEQMWSKLIAELRRNHTVFNPADRASLIDDAFTLSRYSG